MNAVIPRALRRIFWGCLIVIIDLRIDSFDLLFDPVGYALIVGAAISAAASMPRFRDVGIAAGILTVLSLLQLPGFSPPVDGISDGGVRLTLPYTGSGTTVVAGLVESLALLYLIWFLYEAVADWATATHRPLLAEAALTSRRRLMALLIGLPLILIFGAALVPLSAGEALILIVAAYVLVGIPAMAVLWRAGAPMDGADHDPTTNPTSNRNAVDGPGSNSGLDNGVFNNAVTDDGLTYGIVRERRASPLLIVMAALAAIAVVAAVIHQTTPPPPSEAVQAAADNTPPGLETTPAPFEPDRGRDCDLTVGSGRITMPTVLAGIDTTTGSVVWTIDAPEAMNELLTVDGAVLVTQTVVDQQLPSVTAVDATTGMARWRRSFANDAASILAVGDHRVAIRADTDTAPDGAEAILLDGDGVELDRYEDGLLEPGYERDPSGTAQPGLVPPILVDRDLTLGYDPILDMVDPLQAAPVVAAGTDPEYRVLVDNHFGQPELTLFSVSTGELSPLPWSMDQTGIYNRLGSPNSPGLAVQQNDDSVLVLEGSYQGDDSRVTLLDLPGGSVRLQLEHLRSAAMAGPNLVVDRRNEAPADAVTTRTLHLLSATSATGTEADEPLWSTDLSVNRAGGNGYLGLVDGGDTLVFLVDGPTNEPGTEDFLLLPNHAPGPGDTVPTLLQAGGSVGGGPSVRSHVDDDLMVVADGRRLVWRRAGHSTQRLNLNGLMPGSQATAIAVVDDMVVVQLVRASPCVAYGRPVNGLNDDGLTTNIDQPTFNDLNDDDLNDDDGSGYEYGYGDSCPADPSRLSALSLADGTALDWTLAVPHQQGGPVRLGDGVAIIDPVAGRQSPGVTLIDPATGEAKWQRRIDADLVRSLDHGRTHGGTTDDQNRLTLTTTRSTPVDNQGHRIGVIIGADGSIIHEYPIAEDRNGWSGWTGVATDDGWFEPAAALFDETWHVLGNPTSPGDPIQFGDDRILVLVGSTIGPNSKMILLSADGESVRWSREHVRSAALAGPDVLYDKRNESPSDAAATRELYLVDGDDPDVVRWSTDLSVNDAGGNGYLGRVDVGDPTDITQPADIADPTGIADPDDTADPALGTAGGTGARLVFLVDGEDGPEFLLLDPEADPPPVIRAAGALGGGPSPLSLVSPELLMAAVDSTVIWQRPGEAINRATLDGDHGPIRSITVVGDLVVIERGDKPVC